MEVYPDGATYEGYYKNNLRHGPCRILRTTGHIAIGTSMDGFMQGRGKYKAFMDYLFYLLMLVIGLVTYPDGKIYEGSWLRD